MDKPTENALAIIGPVKPKRADAPLPMDEPAMDTSVEPITIDLTAIESRIEQPKAETTGDAPGFTSDIAADWKKFAPLAASLGLAALVGALGGAATTYGLSNGASATAAVASLQETEALRERVTLLSGEVAALKAGIETGNRNAAGQLGKIGERLDRAEKAQAEPAARLAKIAESLDRLERRTAAAAPLPPPDVTGSVTTIEKQQPKPPVVEGWRLLDFYAGRAVLESRNGTLFEVMPGANLPGVGKVETIKRVDGMIVVTTPKGVITSSLEPRRAPYYLPRGY